MEVPGSSSPRRAGTATRFGTGPSCAETATRLLVRSPSTRAARSGGRRQGFLGVAVDITHPQACRALGSRNRSAGRRARPSRSSSRGWTTVAQPLNDARIRPAHRGRPGRAGERRPAPAPAADPARRLAPVQLIDDVLDLSRIEGRPVARLDRDGGHPPVVRDDRDHAPLMAGARRLPGLGQRRAGVDRASRSSPTPPPADQVLVNLLSNAAKANRSGAARRSVRTATGQRFALRVIDTGLGMTPEQVAQLFQPFNRLGLEDKASSRAPASASSSRSG